MAVPTNDASDTLSLLRPASFPLVTMLQNNALLHSTESERAVLGAMFIDPNGVVDVLAKAQPNDFHDPVHRDIFRAIVELYEAGQPVDLLTVSEKLRHNELVNSAGGSAYLAELTTVVPTASNAAAYAEVIKDKAIHRAVAAAGAAITKLGTDPTLTAMEVLERAEQQLLSVSRLSTGAEPEAAYDIASRVYDRYAEIHAAEDPRALIGLDTGFPDIDAKIEGLQPGALLIIAARPSVGKTALALSIARNVAEKQGKKVAIISFEMTKEQIIDRIIASRLGADMWKLKKGKFTDAEFSELGPIFADLKNHPLYIDDDHDTSIANLRSKARRMKMKHGIDLLIVDYLQLIEVTDRSARDNRTQEVTYISRSLKTLAREIGCPVIALSQLSRKVEERSQAIPQLADLRDSGSIEQDADIVLMLYREEVYNEDCDTPGVTDVYIRKNRNGETGRVSLFFDAKRMTFTSQGSSTRREDPSDRQSR